MRFFPSMFCFKCSFSYYSFFRGRRRFLFFLSHLLWLFSLCSTSFAALLLLCWKTDLIKFSPQQRRAEGTRAEQNIHTHIHVYTHSKSSNWISVCRASKDTKANAYRSSSFYMLRAVCLTNNKEKSKQNERHTERKKEKGERERKKTHLPRHGRQKAKHLLAQSTHRNILCECVCVFELYWKHFCAILCYGNNFMQDANEVTSPTEKAKNENRMKCMVYLLVNFLFPLFFSRWFFVWSHIMHVKQRTHSLAHHISM